MSFWWICFYTKYLHCLLRTILEICYCNQYSDVGQPVTLSLDINWTLIYADVILTECYLISMFNTKTDHFALIGVSGLLKLLIIKSCIISTPGVSLNYVNKGKCPTRIGRWSYNTAKSCIYRCNLHFKVRLSYIQNILYFSIRNENHIITSGYCVHNGILRCLFC